MKFYFKEPFNLTCMGKDNEIEFIEICAPTRKVIAAAELDQLVGQSMMEAQKLRSEIKSKELDDITEELLSKKTDKKEKEESIEEKAEQIYLMLSITGKLSSAIESFESCLTKSNAKLNDEILCTKSICADIPYQDFKYIMGTYIVNFINSLQ